MNGCVEILARIRVMETCYKNIGVVMKCGNIEVVREGVLRNLFDLPTAESPNATPNAKVDGRRG